MSNKWVVIGISGATCAGKTTIANQLNKIFPKSQIICQDTYFLPVDDKRHVWIPKLNHINFDIITSLDMDKMYDDVKDILSHSVCTNESSSQKLEQFYPSSIDVQSEVIQRLNRMNFNILILEGFCIFYYRAIEQLCNLKYFITLSEEECYKRRIKRVYEPPDCEGYFEQCAWPEYLKQFDYVKNNVTDTHYISEFTQDPIKVILNDLVQALDCLNEAA